MLNYLFKNESFDIKNPITILIAFFLFIVIILSKQLYNSNLIEGFALFEDVIEKSLLRYIEKYENQPDVDVISSNINFQNTNLSRMDEISKLYIRDFYIKSSFNSCVLDSASKHLSAKTIPILMRRGVRFLDFQIFSKDNQPVVGVNLSDTPYKLTSTTYVPFYDVMVTIKDTFLATYNTDTPGAKTPLFIHIRFGTDMDNIFSEMARIIKNINFKISGSREDLYPPNDTKFRTLYSFFRGTQKVDKNDERENDECKSYTKQLKMKQEFLGDVTLGLAAVPFPPSYFIFDIDDERYYKSELAKMKECYNYKEANFKKFTTEEVRNSNNWDNIKNFSKKGFSMVYPVSDGKYIENTTFPMRDGLECSTDETIPCYHQAMRLGCQFMAMAYNESLETDINFETPILTYDTMFNKMQSSYILKDAELRFFPEFVEVIDKLQEPPEGGWTKRKDNPRCDQITGPVPNTVKRKK